VIPIEVIKEFEDVKLFAVVVETVILPLKI
jgi:hypothetical protein